MYSFIHQNVLAENIDINNNKQNKETTIVERNVLAVPRLCSRFCSVLQPSSIRGLTTPWTYILHLSLSSVILTDSSTRSPVHVLTLSIQAVLE